MIVKMCNKVARRSLGWTALVLGLGACGGGTVQVRGRVTDAEGTQPQGLVSGVAPLAGSGTVAAAAKVRASAVAPGGGLQALSEVSLEAQGRYTLEVPAGQERVVIQAVDGSGQVVASALLDSSGSADSAVAPPMDTESSLEAEVFLQMVADGASPSEVDTVDVRARVSAGMAAAALQGSSSTEAFRSRVRALAEAMRAAQRAEVEAYARAGVQVNQGALFREELAAAATLNAALDAGSDSGQAYEQFHASLATAAERLGAKAEQQLQGERTAGASFRATVKARLSASEAQPLVDAALRASAGLEARASEAALTALLSAAGTAAELKAQAVGAAASLRSQVRASASAAAAAQAFTNFGASVAMGADVQATVLGGYLGVGLAQQVAVSGAVRATASAAATLEVALDTAVSAAAKADSVDTVLLATRVAEAYQAYAAAVRAQASALAVFGAQASPAVELLVLAEGSFLLGT